MRGLSMLLSLSLICCFGCSAGNAPSEVSASDANDTSTASQNSHPAAASASQFLNAIAKGDQATALGRLTPMAAQQLQQSGKGFAFSAVEQSNFELTRVEQPDPKMAAVEYHMTASAQGETVEFDVCCFMQEIDGDWRLGGIAYDLGNGEEPVVVNYEVPQQQQSPAANNPNVQQQKTYELASEGTPAQSPVGNPAMDRR